MVYYNHVWPQIALLTDYLLADFETRSRGAIAFPARYAQGYAYLRSKVYGDRPGTFMGDNDVRLWMPRRLIATDDAQANYLSGYGNGRFYLALSNESTEARSVTVTLDRERIPYAIDRSYSARVWTDGKPSGTTAVVNGKVTLQLSAKGLTAIAVDELPVFTRLQADYFDGEPQPASTDGGFRTDKTPVGNATAMFLSFAGRHEFYLWTSASDSDVRAARLTFKDVQAELTDGQAERKDVQAERTITDERHPFEFSVPTGARTTIEYHLQFVRTDGTLVDGGRHSLMR